MNKFQDLLDRFIRSFRMAGWGAQKPRWSSRFFDDWIYGESLVKERFIIIRAACLGCFHEKGILIVWLPDLSAPSRDDL